MNLEFEFVDRLWSPAQPRSMDAGLNPQLAQALRVVRPKRRRLGGGFSPGQALRGMDQPFVTGFMPMPG